MTVLLQPRALNVRKILITGVALLALFGWSVWRGRRAERAFELSGDTMGSVYAVRLSAPGLTAREAGAIREDLEAYLAGFDADVSTYRPDSALARFNVAPPDTPVPVPARVSRLVRAALEMAERSGGAFDPTVGPLWRAWGLGDDTDAAEPAPEALADARARTGWTRLRIDDEGRLIKTGEGVELDLNALAAGYACDEWMARLWERGVTNAFVELTGEIRVSGRNPSGRPWRIGVDLPVPGAAPGERLAGVMHLTGGGVATAGGYRNFVEAPDGSRWTHILDPRLGRPVEKPNYSVTVVAPTALLADALSTALFVLGPEEGLPWLAQEHPDAEALFLVSRPGGDWDHTATPGFHHATGFEPVNPTGTHKEEE
jgi:FAD:protein FMN transferase